MSPRTGSIPRLQRSDRPLRGNPKSRPTPTREPIPSRRLLMRGGAEANASPYRCDIRFQKREGAPPSASFILQVFTEGELSPPAVTLKLSLLPD